MNVAKYIDHTALKPESVSSDIEQLCNEAKQYGFYSVCVNGCYVNICKDLLKDSDVKITAVIGFPLGAVSTETKVFETKDVVNQGADEVDMVINIGALKDKRYDYVLNDIKSVVDTAKPAIVKVILETCLLTDEEIKKACELCLEAKAHFVKTSTGFNKEGATLEGVKLIKSVVQNNALIKAAGGVRDYNTAVEFINAGANRLGCSSSVKIVNGETAEGNY